MDTLDDRSLTEVPEQSDERVDTHVGDATEPSVGQVSDEGGSDERQAGEPSDQRDGDAPAERDREAPDEGASGRPDRVEEQSRHGDVEPDTTERVQEADQRDEEPGVDTGFEAICHALGHF